MGQLFADIVSVACIVFLTLTVLIVVARIVRWGLRL
jgi:hypothetical protein